MNVKSEDSPTYAALVHPVEQSHLADLNGNRVSMDTVVAHAIDILHSRMKTKGVQLTSPEDTGNYLCLTLGEEPHEIFSVLWLDNRHHLITLDKIFQGTIDGASVHPREVVRRAMLHNAAACVLAHNHPSCGGNTEPSQSDQYITARLREALALIDVRVLDHIIVAGDSFLSFAKEGLFS